MKHIISIICKKQAFKKGAENANRRGNKLFVLIKN